MTKNIFSANQFGINKNLINVDAMTVIHELQKNGFDGLIVGGGIRDLLLHKKPKDFDIVTNATPEIVKKIFRRNSIIIGRRFKIVHVIFNNLNFDRVINHRPVMERHIIEISTYRSLIIHEQSINEFGKILIDNNYGNQIDDSMRRDFTINALYYDPINEIIIDYHDGIEDLKNKIIRIIGDASKRYIEDPVRILRAIRLSVKLNLSIEHETLENIFKFKDLLLNENKGRIYEEMLKILLSGSSVKCIDELKKICLPKKIFILFDDLFFNKNINKFALRVLEKTDERLQLNNQVSVVFILAGLIWQKVNNKYLQFLTKGSSLHQALLDAINANKNYATSIGITKNVFNAMTEIWLLQLEFENPNIKKIEKIISNKRFRQSLHLYNLRNEFKEVDSKLNLWWNQFTESTDNEEKLQLLNQFETLYSNNRKKKRKINN